MSDSASEQFLVFENVTIAYQNGSTVPVLERFSFTLEAGVFLAVLGPSGCGKSSLLHATAGFLRPAAGSIRLKGKAITRPSVMTGFVSQHYALFPWLTVESNIAFGLRSESRPEAEIAESVDRLLDVVGLAARRHYYPDQLSGGMQQRVALARAMALNPPLLLLDEPFAALDAETRRRMQDLLLHLWAERATTIMFVTHDIQEALWVADRILLLTAGGQIRTIDVPFPRPRQRGLESAADFQRLQASISLAFAGGERGSRRESRDAH